MHYLYIDIHSKERTPHASYLISPVITCCCIARRAISSGKRMTPICVIAKMSSRKKWDSLLNNTSVKSKDFVFLAASSMTLLYIFGSVLLVSAVSLVGAFLLLSRDWLERILFPLVSFAAGGLLGHVFLHILPEVTEEYGDQFPTASALIGVGIIFSFVVEKFIRWHHHHDIDCHTHPVGAIAVIGDAVHNMTDGVLIATSYLVDVRLGVLTTIAVVIHEIPQEIGDLAILIYSGYSRARALLMNFLSALAAFAGVLIVLSLNSTLPDIEHYLIPVVAGNFLYIAIADLIPELHKQTKLQLSLLQVLGGGAGILVMFLLLSLE